jgi:acetyl coenzyme A synthetase (ADP forming)-like protein
VVDALAADGTVVRIRPIRPDDAAALVEFHGRLSPDTVHLRFFSAHPRLSAREVDRFTVVDYHDRLALVVEIDAALVAVGRYDATDRDGEAEVAFVVADAYHHRGVGTLLLEHLAVAARARGIRGFVADTLAHNGPAMAMFRAAGFRVTSDRVDLGVVQVTFPIEATDEFVDAVDQRSHIANRTSIERLMRPRSVAVVGAGVQPGGIGHEVFRNVVEGGFTGAMYPINRSGAPVLGHPGYATLLDLPADVDLVVVAIPGAGVLEVAAQAVTRRSRALVVLSAGFAETGPEGANVQRRFVEVARLGGMRLVGPNCLGLANTAADISLDATFAPAAPAPGHTALSSQSGAVGIVALAEAAAIGLGLSSFVSVGNKADVSGNDLLEYWEDDPATNVICLYLESFGNPRRFARLARRVSRAKPIVALKSGRSTAGRRAGLSHTAAAATSDVVVDALFAQAGVIRVDTLTELFDTALVLADQPRPVGRRVAIVGNSGGPGILAADACEAAGLVLPELGDVTQAALRSFLAPAAATANPVDLLAAASAEQYAGALAAVLADPVIDAVIAIYTPPTVTTADPIAAAVAAASTESATKPIVACFLAGQTVPAPFRHPLPDRRRVPCLPAPERAAHALARAARYREWTQRPPGRKPDLPGIDERAATAVVGRCMHDDRSGGWLPAADVEALLRSYAIAMAETVSVADSDQAVAAARRLGYPVVLKAGSPELAHKTDVGAVRLGLSDDGELRRAFAAMGADLGPAMGGGIVQAMADTGVETVVGVVNDPLFGPLVMFGLGGVATELLGDRAFRILPLTDIDATELVRSLRGSPLLTGYRGSTPVDMATVEDLVLRVARLAEQFPEIAELDLNPVIATPAGVVAVDAKIRLAPPAPASESWLPRLA